MANKIESNKVESRSVSVAAPYELPEGWKWTKLGDVCQKIKRGKSPKYVDKSGTLVFAQKCNQPDGTISLEKALFLNDDLLSKYKENDFVKNGDVLINSTGTGTIGRVGYFDKSILSPNLRLVTDTHVTTVRCNDNNCPKFFYFFLKQKENYLELKGVGTTNMKELHADVLENLSFPLPPTLAEQKRIVSRIESMFTKLDEATDKAQSVVDGFELRRAAILHKAFTGELTAKWRKENGVKDESWEEKRLEDVCEKIVCGKTPKEFISTTGDIPYLKVYNISNNKIDFETTPQFIPKEIHEGKLASSILKPYDVIMNIVGPPLRKIAIIPEDYPEWNMNQAIVRFRPLNEVNYKYLYWALINPETLSSVIEETRGVVGQQNISVSQSRNLIIPVPTLPEQQEIVRILDTVLEKESRAKETAQTVLDQIALLKKSILARAFRGEL